MSAEFGHSVRATTKFPLLWRWLTNTANDPQAQQRLLSILWRAVTVALLALLAERLAQFALRRPLGALEARAARETRPAEPREVVGADKVAVLHVRRLTGLRSAVGRAPQVAARLGLALAPIAAFAAVGNSLLATNIGEDPVARIAILALVNAYVICRTVMSVLRALIGGSTQATSLFALPAEIAIATEAWVRRIVGVAVFGLAFANIARALGLYRPAYWALVGYLTGFPTGEILVARYRPVLRLAVSTIITIVAIGALLESWGVDIASWFDPGRIGALVLSELSSVILAVAIAVVVWEACNTAIERQLARFAREGAYARAARLRTLLPMLRTALIVTILTIAGLTALSAIGVNIAPLLAGAGIVGIAVGFGSQKLVQDVVTGVFLLLENAMQVGDFVTVSGLSGTVENLSVRSIRLRAGDGSVHIIPFSSVTSVTNTNRGIGNAAVSVNLAYGEDIDKAGEVLKQIAAEMRREPQFKALMRGDLDLWGVDKVDGATVTIVGQIECTDSGRWPVQREFNRRMKMRFQQLGLDIAYSTQTRFVADEYFSRARRSAAGDAAE
ncbi:MAG: mechanosensitive ion channel domain-containing protein [Roseiarcus sp.]